MGLTAEEQRILREAAEETSPLRKVKQPRDVAKHLSNYGGWYGLALCLAAIFSGLHIAWGTTAVAMGGIVVGIIGGIFSISFIEESIKAREKEKKDLQRLSRY